ncbi:MAG: SCO family protein [Rhodocyclaceae bacterium]|nr:SCO family protein [Rhodocyclaceae bacterium]
MVTSGGAAAGFGPATTIGRCLAVFLAASLLFGCGDDASKPAFNGTDITGADYARGFSLTDSRGHRRGLADFAGRAVAVFFGYTQCPDVCPTTLTQMAAVMEMLGQDAERLQVVFITVDPERDTPALLAEYMPLFDARFIALYGTRDETEKVTKDFRVFYRKSGDVSGNRYTVDHSAGLYLFDPAGRLRLYYKHGEQPGRIAADVRRLLAGE